MQRMISVVSLVVVVSSLWSIWYFVDVALLVGVTTATTYATVAPFWSIVWQSYCRGLSSGFSIDALFLSALAFRL
jgi:hypothetical protein